MKLLLTFFLFVSTAIAAFPQTDSTANLYRFTTEEHLLSLKQEVINSERLIHNASGETEKLAKSVYSATVITAAEIQASGATNVAEILRMSPLFSVGRSGNEVYSVRVPGGPAPDLSLMQQADFLVLIDDIPFNDSGEGHVFWEHIPLEINQIERIEIILGPASERFGPSAASGVIQIFSRNLDGQSRGGDADLMFSDPNLYRYSANLRFNTQEKIKFTVGGRYDFSQRTTDRSYLFDLNRTVGIDSLTLFQENAPATNPYSRRSSENFGFNARLLIKLNNKSNLMLYGSRMSSVTQGVFGRVGQIAHHSRSMGTTQFGLKSRLLSVSLAADFKIGKRNYAEGYPGRSFDFRQGFFRLGHKKAFSDRLRMRSGLEVRYDYLKSTGSNSDNFVSFLNAQTLSQSVLSGFAALDGNFGKWRGTLDARLDRYSISGETFLNIRPALTYRINAAQHLRFSYSSGQSGNYFRNFYEQSEVKVLDLESESRTFVNRTASVNSGLGLMSIRTAELGWRVQKDRFYADLSIFNRSYSGAFVTENLETETGLHRELMNRKTVFSQSGVNLAARLDLVNVECLAYFTLLAPSGCAECAQPLWSGGLNLIYSAFFNKLKINIQTQIRDKYTFSTSSEVHEIPMRLSGDAKVSYKIYKNHAVFASYRSFLQESVVEVPFGDPITSFYILGLHLSI